MLRPGNPYTRLCRQALLVAFPEADVVFPKVCLSVVSIMHAKPAGVTDLKCILMAFHAAASSNSGRAACLSLVAMQQQAYCPMYKAWSLLELHMIYMKQ